jgi:hypothetical protein
VELIKKIRRSQDKSGIDPNIQQRPISYLTGLGWGGVDKIVGRSQDKSGINPIAQQHPISYLTGLGGGGVD